MKVLGRNVIGKPRTKKQRNAVKALLRSQRNSPSPRKAA